MVQPWKALKVFVSSTFKDLERERDRLGKAFDRVKEKIGDRRLSLIPYDLRWRDRNPGEPVVEWCLDAVASCQYFINILDGRYGWRPGGEGTLSITEMEIEEAASRGARRLFFFRDEHQIGLPEEVGETAADRADLDRLKSTLASGGEPIAVWSNVDDLVGAIEHELSQAIDRDYPRGRIVTEDEITLTEATRELIEAKLKGFVGRTSQLEHLAKFVRSPAGPQTLLVHSVAGAGKSALAARFVAEREVAAPGIPVVAHFLGTGGRAREPAVITQGLADGLAAAGVLAESPEVEPSLRLRQVARAVAETAQPVVLVIDGVDEVEETGRDLAWIPAACGPRVKFIVTTRPVGVKEALESRSGVKSYELPPLTDDEMERIVADSVRASSLPPHSPEEVRELIRRAAGNPLFLKVALDEIVAGGLAVGQLATSVDGLFRQITGRLDREFGEERLRDYLGLIAAGREGLAEDELAEVFPRDAPIPSGELASITRSLANFIVSRRRLLTFFHAEFERSIKERIGVGPMREYHRRLLTFFGRKGTKRGRRLVELAHQATKAESWQNLLNILSHLPYLEAKASAGLVVDLAADYEFALRRAPVTLPTTARLEKSCGVVVTRHTLELLCKSLGRDLPFLVRHPRSLFQQLYNYGYWHDAPGTAHRLFEPAGSPTPAATGSLSALVEGWRHSLVGPRCRPWFRSRRPPAVGLASPVRAVLRGHEYGVFSAAFSPDSRMIVSAGPDAVRVWDACSGDEIAVVRAHVSFNCAAFSPDGRKIVSASGDNTVRVFHAHSGEKLAVLRGHESSVESAVFSPDGRKIVSTSLDKTVRVWDENSAEELAVLRGHEKYVRSAAFSPDGRKIVSASEDKTIRVWDANSGREVAVLPGHEDTVESAAFSPDGRKIVSASLPEGSLSAIATDPGGRVHALGTAGGHLAIYEVAGEPGAGD